MTGRDLTREDNGVTVMKEIWRGARLLAPALALAALLFPAAVQAADIKGAVKEISGKEIIIRVEGNLAPQPGDAVKVTLEHPALGTLNVGEWVVKSVAFPSVTAALKEATGDPEPLMTAVISSAKPVDMTVQVKAAESVKLAKPAGSEAEKRLIAALRQDPAADVSLLLKGVNVNTTDSGGAFPLALAAGGGSIENARLLLMAGADPNLESPHQGQTALKVAAARGAANVIPVLLEAGAVLDHKGGEYDHKYSQVTALFIAAAQGQAEAVRLLLERGADPYVEDKWGEPAVSAAARGGHINVVQAFANAGVSLDYVSSTGVTPLLAAAGDFEANWEMYVYLLGAGANVNAQIPKNAKMDADFIGMSPLMLAAEGQGEVFLLLAAGADPSLRNAKDRTAADIAAARLEEAKAQGSPLDDYLEIQRALKEPESGKQKGKAQINKYLSDTVEENNLLLAASLLALGADANLIESAHDEPVLSLAAKEGHGPMARLLIEHGASPNTPGKDGVSPFLHVFESRDVDLAKYMLSHGADPKYMPAGSLFNVMHGAAATGFAEIIPDLAKAGVDPNARGEEGNTPLHLAASEGHVEAFQALIAVGANPQLKNDDGKTPLELVSDSKRADFEKAMRGGGAGR